jgi:hypothetical protein
VLLCYCGWPAGWLCRVLLCYCSRSVEYLCKVLLCYFSSLVGWLQGVTLLLRLACRMSMHGVTVLLQQVYRMSLRGLTVLLQQTCRMTAGCNFVTAAGLYYRLRFKFAQGSLRIAALRSETGDGAESWLCEGALPISAQWDSARVRVIRRFTFH